MKILKAIFLIYTLISSYKSSFAVDAMLLDTNTSALLGVINRVSSTKELNKESIKLYIDECVGVDSSSALPISMSDMRVYYNGFFASDPTISKHKENVKIFIKSSKEIYDEYSKTLDTLEDKDPRGMDILRKLYCLYHMLLKVEENYCEE